MQSSYLLLFASAQMVVILTRGFDLSLGMAVSAISVATALVTTGLAAAARRRGSSSWRGLRLASASALLVGLFNGRFHRWLGINPFVVTLGSLNICLGLATTMSGGRPVFNVPDAFSRLLYDGNLIPGISIPMMLAAVVCPAALFPARSHGVRAVALPDRQQPARRASGGVAEQALPDPRLYPVRAVGRFRIADADGADRFGRTEPRRQPDARKHRRRRHRRRQPAGRGGRHHSRHPRNVCSSPCCPTRWTLLEVGGYVQQILLGCVIIGAIFLDRIRVTRT